MAMYYSDHPVWADAHTIILLDIILLVHKGMAQTCYKCRHSPPTHLALGGGTAVGWWAWTPSCAHWHHSWLWRRQPPLPLPLALALGAHTAQPCGAGVLISLSRPLHKARPSYRGWLLPPEIRQSQMCQSAWHLAWKTAAWFEQRIGRILWMILMALETAEHMLWSEHYHLIDCFT